jgi:predicted hotdog family 3-hydroxylacyl-ACP dehydratase
MNNPLRASERLGVACGIEYAAQAMAAHGALMLVAGQRPRAGYLTSVRAVYFHIDRLDDLAPDLSIEAERLSGNDNNNLYRFRITAGELRVASGRAAVVLDAETSGRST